MQTVRKYLVYEYVPIVERTFRSGTRESCVSQQTIYVILRGNEETRGYINQARNVLRLLLFCQLVCFYCTTTYPILALLPVLSFISSHRQL